MAEHDGVEGLGIAADLEELRRLEPPAEDPAQRERTLRAVLKLAATQAAGRTPRRGRVVGAVGALAAAAVVVLAWSLVGHESAQRAPSDARVEGTLRVQSGSVAAGGAVLFSGAWITPRTVVVIGGEPTALQLADASVVQASPRTTLVYTSGGEDRFRLELGRVSLRVASRAHGAPLVVETAELSAWVVGTRFAVSRTRVGHASSTVVVDEGVVRVVAKSSGETQLLHAGAQLTVSDADRGEQQAQAQQPAVPAALAGQAQAGTNRSAAPARHAISSEIRQKLREGAIGSARRLIARAQRERAVGDAELAMLQAEADLAERRPERAKSRYLAIVARYPGSSEAELSLFAAAQLSHGRAGIDLLQRYLARYPDGRFAQEANRLLTALEARSGAR